jgi:hypothetical protein
VKKVYMYDGVAALQKLLLCTTVRIYETLWLVVSKKTQAEKNYDEKLWGRARKLWMRWINTKESGQSKEKEEEWKWSRLRHITTCVMMLYDFAEEREGCDGLYTYLYDDKKAIKCKVLNLYLCYYLPHSYTILYFIPSLQQKKHSHLNVKGSIKSVTKSFREWVFASYYKYI